MRAILPSARVISTDQRSGEKNGKPWTMRTAYVVSGGGRPEEITIWPPNPGEVDLWPALQQLEALSEVVHLVVTLGASAYGGRAELKLGLVGFHLVGDPDIVEGVDLDELSK